MKIEVNEFREINNRVLRKYSRVYLTNEIGRWKRKKKKETKNILKNPREEKTMETNLLQNEKDILKKRKKNDS